MGGNYRMKKGKEQRSEKEESDGSWGSSELKK